MLFVSLPIGAFVFDTDKIFFFGKMARSLDIRAANVLYC